MPAAATPSIITLVSAAHDAETLESWLGLAKSVLPAAARLDEPFVRSVGEVRCAQARAWAPLTAAELRKELGRIPELNQKSVDVVVQPEEVYLTPKRLLVFDMDSTLIAIEGIDELAALAGVGDQVRAVTEAAMNGQLDFNESLRRRLALLRGLEESKVLGLTQNIPLTAGAEKLIQELKGRGCKVAVASGGFTHFSDKVKTTLELDYVETNRLEIEDGRLTGRTMGPVVNAERKASFLEELAAREGIGRNAIIAIGDGANDIPMLKRAGLGIAFNAKPAVCAQVEVSLRQQSLASVLLLLPPA